VARIGNEAPAGARAPVDQARERKLEAELSALPTVDIDGLRLRWRKLFRKAAPTHLPRYLLFRIITYRLQADVYGDLDRETAAYVDRIAQERIRRNANGEPRKPKAVPPIPPVPNRRPLKPGTLLAREHGGVMQRVVVVPDGFLWNETTYASLSEVARAITGTNWNGPRFFGLRDEAAKQPRTQKGKPV
jgi:Protein of unknown function (DUF2924)